MLVPSPSRATEQASQSGAFPGLEAGEQPGLVDDVLVHRRVDDAAPLGGAFLAPVRLD